MTEREARIRELVARLSQEGSGVGPEYSLLSLDDARFLLEELSFVRDEYDRAFSNGAVAAMGGIPPSQPIPRLR